MPTGTTVVYVGTLHADRLDIELCTSIATALSQTASAASLVLVGPDALVPSDRERIRKAGGLVLGTRPASAIPAYVMNADVLVVPHLVNAFTDSLNPIKLYEYLAAGRPIISTPVAGFRDTNWPTIGLSSREDFADDVVTAAIQRSETLPPPGWLPTWANQAGLFADVLDRISAARSPR